ncbi:MAG: hypothetical protein JWM41_4159 [Gemmatimonadetes bacterium]|nr:hypothetical protein [Gemmatimonadota bacterium]
MSQYEFEDDEPYVVIEKHDAPSIAPFLIGLAMGAGVALLLAPRSGAATRRDIKRRARRVQRAAQQVATDVTDGVVGTFEEARRRVEEQIDTARQAIDLKRRQVNRAMEAGRVAAQEARDELEQRIAETKAAYGATATASRASRSDVAADELDEA